MWTVPGVARPLVKDAAAKCVGCSLPMSKRKGALVPTGEGLYHPRCIPRRQRTTEDLVKGDAQRRAVRAAVLRGDKLA